MNVELISQASLLWMIQPVLTVSDVFKYIWRQIYLLSFQMFLADELFKNRGSKWELTLSHKSLWLVALYYDFFFYILNISFYVSLNSPSMVTLYMFLMFLIEICFLFPLTLLDSSLCVSWFFTVRSYLVCFNIYGQEEKGMTEGEMVGWHHRLHGHEFE